MEIILFELLTSGQSGLLDLLSKENNAFALPANTLKEIVNKIEPTKRGKDYLTSYIEQINKKIIIKSFQANPESIIAIFDYFAFSGEHNKVEFSLNDFDFRKLDLSLLAKLLLSLYKYSADAYQNWFNENRTSFMNYLKYSLDLMALEINSEEIESTYLTNDLAIEITIINNASMKRINLLRSLCPHLKMYSIRAEWVIFNEIPCDSSIKNIPIDNLPDELTIKKNVFFRTHCLSMFQTSSMYDFQKHWYELRRMNMELIKLIIPIYEKLLRACK